MVQGEPPNFIAEEGLDDPRAFFAAKYTLSSSMRATPPGTPSARARFNYEPNKHGRVNRHQGDDADRRGSNKQPMLCTCYRTPRVPDCPFKKAGRGLWGWHRRAVELEPPFGFGNGSHRAPELFPKPMGGF